jgi:accessory gene regulator B
MLNYLADRSAGILLRSGVIGIEEKEIYFYGFELFYSTCFTAFSILLIASLFNCPGFGIIFIMFFVPTRLYSGGYHAKSFGHCFFCSNFCFGVVFLFSWLIPEYFIIYANIIISVVCSIYIIIHSPVEHEHNKMTLNRKIKCRKMTAVLLFMENLIIWFVTFNNPVSRIGLMAALTMLGVVVFIYKAINEMHQGLS